MTKNITQAERDRIERYIDRNTDYDVRTVRIAKNGDVTAVKDADKTRNAPEKTRYLVGRVGDCLFQ